MKEPEMCPDCGKIRYRYLDVMGITKKVGIQCDCMKKNQQEHEEREKQEEVERQKRICFKSTDMIDWSFENDDRSNEKISDSMKKYADDFQNYLHEGKGLLLTGTVGTGKTYFAACIANKLIEDGYRVYMTNFATLINMIQSTYDGKQEIIDSLQRYSLLIVDDLGAERKSEYMQETVYNIIDARYRSGKPMIITSNIPLYDICNSEEIGYQRIYDRILEKCIPIEFKGANRRKQKANKRYHSDRVKLGIV